MKKLVLIFAVLALYSCKEKLPEVNVNKKNTTYILREFYDPLQIVIVDSCEYFYTSEGHAIIFTHKGNCKNHKQ